MLSFIVIAAAWLAVGAIAVAVMHHRGHDVFSWALLFVFLGPLAIPVAVSADRHPPAQPPWPDREGSADLLVDYDGSPQCMAALDAALDLLGSRVTSVTIATVVDAEAATSWRGHETQQEAQARLDVVRDGVAARVGVPVDSVVLFGEPCRALASFATEHGYELVVGPARVAKHNAVPVLVGPAKR